MLVRLREIRSCIATSICFPSWISRPIEDNAECRLSDEEDVPYAHCTAKWLARREH